MIVLGVTGSIGMGKSTVCGMLARMGVPVHDADATVHRLMAPGGAAVAPVEAAFPGVTDASGAIDRQRLRAAVVGKPPALARLEAIVHPLVRAEERQFLARNFRAGTDVVVLDVPLLFETGGEDRCDAVVVVSAPALVQRQRVLRRPTMTAQTLAGILSRQMPDAQKRRRADYVIPTGRGKGWTWRALRTMLDDVRTRRPQRKGRRHHA